MKRLDEIFDLRYGHSLELNALNQVAAPDGCNFVSRAMGNNGVTARVETVEQPGSAGEITVALSGNGVLSSFVQPEPFVTGFHVMILRAKNSRMSLQEKLWWCRCIWENRYRFSYGRQANRTLGSLQMPEDPPSWVFDSIVPTHTGLASPSGPRMALPDITGWGEYRLDQLFEVRKGRRVTKANRGFGPTRFVGASDKNNGITDMCDLPPIFPAHTLSVPYNGSVGFAFYQDEPYFASDDVQVLVPNAHVSRLSLLFVASMIRYEKSRFSYGYKWHLERMRATTIRLPALINGDPDWDLMDRFMRGLPFSVILENRSHLLGNRV